MLIKTIERETGADDLFSKAAPILTASSEVAYHTMNVSALNSEELCRENGIPVSIITMVTVAMVTNVTCIGITSSVCSLCLCFVSF